MLKKTKEILELDLIKAEDKPKTVCPHCHQKTLKLEPQNYWYICTNCNHATPIDTDVALFWEKCSACNKLQLVTADEKREESPHKCTFCSKDEETQTTITCSNKKCKRPIKVDYEVASGQKTVTCKCGTEVHLKHTLNIADT